MTSRTAFGVIIALMAFAALALACAGPQPLPLAPTPIPTLIPATLPPEPTQAPLPTSTGPAGASIFGSNCSTCHNLTAERKVGPGLQGLFSLPALPNGKPVNDENLRDWIRNGGGAMPPIALSDADLAAVIAYLKQATQ
jgi:mono/diheme cytochrome c family protein